MPSAVIEKLRHKESIQTAYHHKTIGFLLIKSLYKRASLFFLEEIFLPLETAIAIYETLSEPFDVPQK